MPAPLPGTARGIIWKYTGPQFCSEETQRCMIHWMIQRDCVHILYCSVLIVYVFWSVGDKLLTGAVSLSARRHIWLSTSPAALRKLSPHVHVQGILACKTRQNIRLTLNRKDEVRREVVWVRCYVAIGRSVDDSVYRQFAPCTCSSPLSGESDFLRDTFANKTLGIAIIYWMTVGFRQKVDA